MVGSELELGCKSSLQTVVDEGQEFLHEYFPREQGFWRFAFSGGKDSLATKEMLDMSGLPYISHYACTTIDPPEIYKFIKTYHPEVEWKMPVKGGFYKRMREKMMIPTAMCRWCCDDLKKFACKNEIFITGVRRSESKNREKQGSVIKREFRPIFKFTDEHIWDFIHGNGIMYPELYDQGFDRIGCVVCPLICGSDRGTIAKVARHKERWPKHWRAFYRAYKYVFEKLDSPTMCFEESYRNWELRKSFLGIPDDKNTCIDFKY